jgi:very-short-patch-repair endonuclease
MGQKTHNSKAAKPIRKELRKSLTPAEAYLWKQLNARKFKGLRFTKQHGIGKYIVDFYCASEKLIIELDGEVHNNPTTELYDNERTRYLEALGYKVVRFENKMVFEHLPSVFKEIDSQTKKK